jgi:hypothetical protein
MSRPEGATAHHGHLGVFFMDDVSEIEIELMSANPGTLWHCSGTSEMQETRQHIVIVRNAAGEVVHTTKSSMSVTWHR